MPSDRPLIAGITQMALTSLANELPPAVLRNIAARLSRMTLLTAITLCRSWNATLTHELYSTVEIRREDQLELFIKTLTTIAPDKRLGFLVFNFCTDTFLDEDTARLLPQLLPNVTSVSCPYNGAFCQEILPILQEWKQLRKISRLRLKEFTVLPTEFLRNRLSELELGGSTIETWIDTVADIKTLERLCIVVPNYRDPEQIVYGNTSLDLLERLQNGLPRLRSFSLQVFKIDGDLPEHIVPCGTVRELVFQTMYCNDACGEYFARKYPKLEKLAIEGQCLWMDISPLAISFPFLREFATSDQVRYTKFFDVRAMAGLTISHVSFCDTIPWQLEKLQAFHTTLANVQLDSSCVGVPVKKIIEHLKACETLATLDIRYHHHTMNLDWIVNGQQNLRNLTLRGTRVSVSKEDTTTIPHHRLKRLHMTANIIEDDVYLYLSRHCVHLENLGSYYREPISQQHLVYYPCPGLQCLVVMFHFNEACNLTRMKEEERIKAGHPNAYKSDENYEPLGRTHRLRYRSSGENLNVSQQNPLKPEDMMNDIQKDDLSSTIQLQGESDEQILLPTEPIIHVVCHYVDLINIGLRHKYFISHGHLDPKLLGSDY
ncbi:hypothetical protein EC973_008020 [Apophysomyces ossiformis]|uniref:F-box domain-containing protein n=1 Tax=Apophysomyces ossiformis TaxID=679940 RepID=A0A8H7BEA6_9FUNG|nr:hypothetical protein EC973_008020 [Apophysomyces ossiformis]